MLYWKWSRACDEWEKWNWNPSSTNRMTSNEALLGSYSLSYVTYISFGEMFENIATAIYREMVPPMDDS